MMKITNLQKVNKLLQSSINIGFFIDFNGFIDYTLW